MAQKQTAPAGAVPPRRTRNVQAGPRSQAVIEAVRTATLAELDRVGYAAMTMDGVARAAGINRTTLYRRWPSKAALLGNLLDSEIDRLEQPPLPPGLGPALDAVLAGLADNLSRREGVALARTFTAPEPELRDLARASRLRALARIRAPFEAAAASGEIAADSDIDMLAQLLFSTAVLWTLEQGLDRAAQQRLLVLVLRAAGASPVSG
ncbi:TetR/AcrR family transcriptional regulator [Devosia sediminis]|uniref:TetR/AcrR family transcriptional regulator n=1 Tax=Devosia sediminis TaxID=2798801 RepID=A0A934J0F9_9HYPH|nr:TetR/AcrR family transcriptional regulator [Devosia sediminis]MBJ3785998.1 TetR/AcrR family transcriptional regulator [Devosia sediminis]